MADRSKVLISEEGSRRRGAGALPPSDLWALAPILIVGGLMLGIAGWSDVALFYWPPHFGNMQWEFGVIAHTFDVMPLPTLGLLLVALGVRARGGAVVWPRGLAVVLALVAVLCLAALVLFALNIPPALKSLREASTAANQQTALASSGLKRGMAKALLFGSNYVAGYAALAGILWRKSRPAKA